MKKSKKIIKVIFVILILTGVSAYMISYLAFNENYERGMAQYLRHLDYQVKMNDDGSMDVVETWDIDIGCTNTLVRTFNLNKSKFGEISNVEIVDLEDETKFANINKEMYHVPKGSFYALQTYSSEFEIAFGIGMDYKTGNRKFQISYTIEDVVTDYKDCQEIYWQFLAEGQNLIPAGKVTGTLTLPEGVSNIDNLLIWGHGQLNGTIEKVNNSQVKFEVDDLSAGAMLEIRVVTKDEIFEVNTNKIRGYNYLQKILEDEEKWAQTANENIKRVRCFIFVLLILYAITIIIVIIKIIKALKIEKDDYTKKDDLKYFRDIPRETATPAEAAYLYKFNKTRLNTANVQSDAVAATILDLCYKRKIELSTDKYGMVYIKVISDSEGLKKDELEIYNLLTKVAKKGEILEISQLETYANKKYQTYSNIINKFVDSARNSLYKLGLIDKSEEKIYAKSKKAEDNVLVLKIVYLLGIIIWSIMQIPIYRFRLICYYGAFLVKDTIKILIALLPLVLLYIWYWKIQKRIQNKIAVLTQEGSEEQAKWKGLANYMKDYSLLDEKDVLSLELWEKYLIYATAFGIADKVIEQMRAKYPEVFIKEKWEDENMKQNYPVIHFSLNPMYDINSVSVRHSISSIEKGVSRAYGKSISQITTHSGSDSFGGGGSFSSGGGGRWRPVAGMSGR